MSRPWRDVARLLRDPACSGAGPIQLLAKDDFYDEEDLPFLLLGGGSVVHIVPDAGFRKESLAGSEDERLLIVDCPDDEGWLVPEDIVADWLARHVSCPPLEDLILSHPLYEYLTAPDEEGRSRGGHRGELVQWAPGIPNLASVYAPEWLPDDPDAPAVNREREAYSMAVQDLLEQLERSFDLLELELGLRFAEPHPGKDAEGATERSAEGEAGPEARRGRAARGGRPRRPVE